MVKTYALFLYGVIIVFECVTTLELYVFRCATSVAHFFNLEDFKMDTLTKEIIARTVGDAVADVLEI